MNENKSYLRSSTDNNGPPYYRFDSNGPQGVTVTVLFRISKMTVTVLIADFYRVDLWARSFDFSRFFSIELFHIFHFLCMWKPKVQNQVDSSESARLCFEVLAGAILEDRYCHEDRYWHLPVCLPGKMPAVNNNDAFLR